MKMRDPDSLAPPTKLPGRVTEPNLPEMGKTRVDYPAG